MFFNFLLEKLFLLFLVNELRSLHQKAGKTTFDEKQENDAQRKIEVITLEITNVSIQLVFLFYVLE